MWSYRYRADYKERIEIGHLSLASPDRVLQWLKESWTEPDKDHHLSLPYEDNGRQLLEYVLLRRRDPLINYGLARYGYCRKTIQQAYDRGDASTRYAAIANPRGGPVLSQVEEILRTGHPQLVQALLKNEFLPSGFIENLLSRKENFEGIPDDRFMVLIVALTGNKRLNRQYDTLYIDGYDDYRYHSVFKAAWDLTTTLPATQAWASVLSSFLHQTQRSYKLDDLEGTIKRWDIDSPDDQRTWYQRSQSFHLRTLLADYYDADDDKLLGSEDLALRMSFYRRFAPYKYREWPDFLAKDGENFVEAVMNNMNVWQSASERERLNRVAWDCPDEHHSMSAPNDFRSRQAHYRKEYPNWFRDEDGPSIEKRLEDMQEQLERMRGSIQELAARRRGLFS
jgi:hypothetical protein